MKNSFVEKGFKFDTAEELKMDGFIGGVSLNDEMLGEDDKRYACIWNSINYQPAIAIVTIDFFKEEFGFEDEDILGIKNLNVGEQRAFYSPFGNDFNVQRIF